MAQAPVTIDISHLVLIEAFDGPGDRVDYFLANDDDDMAVVRAKSTPGVCRVTKARFGSVSRRSRPVELWASPEEIARREIGNMPKQRYRDFPTTVDQ